MFSAHVSWKTMGDVLVCLLLLCCSLMAYLDPLWIIKD